ncbi:MAG: hypothetical protein CM15mV34_0810 [Caudoviricetes sp.]|nr:MAG: hypothetical protein CM15mV34_0810 [Caudoviricetes sp.]
MVLADPFKSMEYKLSYLVEEIAEIAAVLVKTDKSGEFIDMVTGKLVTIKELTAKLQNFLSAIFTQVIGAIRQSLANLAEQLDVVNLLASATGIPFVVFTTIQTAVTQILSQLCIIDSQLLGYITNPLASVTNALNSFLDGIISKAEMILQSVQKVIDDVVCNVEKIVNKALGIVNDVKSIVNGIGKAKEIIDAWEKATEIFEVATDLFKKNLNLTGLMAIFLKFAAGNCNRPVDGGKDVKGFYPLFGVTHCSESELASINKIRGRSVGQCGDNDQGGLIDNIFNKADPYIQSATTYINGAYDLFVGTPGREGTQRKNENGTTHTSIKLNNKEYAKWKWLQAKRKEKPNMSEEQLNIAYTEYIKNQTGDNNDDAVLVADHSSYAGNYTCEVHGDDCKQIDGDYVRTIDGDYHLKVTGDCHIEVGGGFFLDAEGAPKVVDKHGNKKNEKIQKHTIKFGSDVDMSVVGAKFELQGAECKHCIYIN